MGTVQAAANAGTRFRRPPGQEVEGQERTGESEKDPEDYADYLDYDPEADRGDE